GFYNGKIDGVFGWGTYWALRNFQYEFGMEIDGMAGQATKQKLEKASTYNKNYVHEQINKGNDFTHYGGVDKEKQTKPSSEDKQQQSAPSEDKKEQDQSSNSDLAPTAVNVPQGFSQNDIQIIANAVHGEARGEPYEGKVAVAAVILNRVESASFPNSISGVI